jgi:hypothetical protein
MELGFEECVTEGQNTVLLFLTSYHGHYQGCVAEYDMRVAVLKLSVEMIHGHTVK